MEKSYTLLVINPGSTSTKLAVFRDDEKIFSKSINHDPSELADFSWVMDQREFRTKSILDALTEGGFSMNDMDCIMSRGGMIPPCRSGAYRVNEAMLECCYSMHEDQHISNVGCAVALSLAELCDKHIEAYIYDPVTVDELQPIARITGIPELPKRSRGHALNTHAMARRCAAEVMHKPFEECTFIVAHMGGGCSTWLIDKGYSIDMYSDDDASFAPERSGRIQAIDLIGLCYSGKYTHAQMAKKIRGGAGLKAHLGTSDAREVERMINEGDEHARLIYEAMAYGTAKTIGDLATVVYGKVDRIILTGGVAYSKMLTDMIVPRVEWIAPVEIMAGEYEMEALAEGGFRLLRGQEKAIEFTYNK